MTTRRPKGCEHCGGELAPIEGNPFKAGRVLCGVCGCSFLDGALATRGRSCLFSPPEAVTPPAASVLHEGQV